MQTARRLLGLDHPTPVEAMARRLATPEGKKLYALRKQKPEPVFGILKSVLDHRYLQPAWTSVFASERLTGALLDQSLEQPDRRGV